MGRGGLPISRGCRQLGQSVVHAQGRCLPRVGSREMATRGGCSTQTHQSCSRAAAHLELKRELLAHGEHLARVAQGQVRRQLPRIKLPLHVLLCRRLGDEANLQAPAAACEATQAPAAL